LFWLKREKPLELKFDDSGFWGFWNGKLWLGTPLFEAGSVMMQKETRKTKIFIFVSRLVISKIVGGTDRLGHSDDL
jgi:hypothetical protein